MKTLSAVLKSALNIPVDFDFIKDVVNDIAFLKLNQSPNISLMNIAVGDSSQMQIGNKVFTIGYPISNILGQKPKYSEGVINSLSGIKDNLGFFQVSVPIQSGNSGGPLFNQHGELVAMPIRIFVYLFGNLFKVD